MYSCTADDLLIEHYTDARMNYIDELVEIDGRPDFIKEKEHLDSLTEKASAVGFNFKNKSQLINYFKKKLFWF